MREPITFTATPAGDAADFVPTGEQRLQCNRCDSGENAFVVYVPKLNDVLDVALVHAGEMHALDTVNYTASTRTDPEGVMTIELVEVHA